MADGSYVGLGCIVFSHASTIQKIDFGPSCFKRSKDYSKDGLTAKMIPWILEPHYICHVSMSLP